MNFTARVYVSPKPAILDPQGKAIASSLHSMGYAEVADARVGKLIVLRMRAADRAAAASRVEEMCRRLLANEVIEEFHYEIADGGEAAQ